MLFDCLSYIGFAGESRGEEGRHLHRKHWKSVFVPPEVANFVSKIRITMCLWISSKLFMFFHHLNLFIIMAALESPWPIEWLGCGWTEGFKPRSSLRELHNLRCSKQRTLSGRGNKAKGKRNWVVKDLFLCWFLMFNTSQVYSLFL